ncbi:flavodoxin-dependent (E)-4-hydroxy-3-methylbut-2-enyl-diphosphate synthase [Thermodesulfobacterium sp. TA1]|uniref:flavodoxin-dependent (E)-4-hydroxy-3-methylbut-2-enyl-diphosphate synthase n=1 Tax=Thermodesulfobacterium sp. TA1 TaxID=2234087 RepID=UPI0012327A91|nr:flavodoxin-dependent (E)-4-hydroxy-3-methylbut-2-enyl-diphosphate synthase [Thermodesulfobacterium sp. TA1]QER42559.1 flavodoxin-dependent (E)-4-hydroxy-3-methylbut-2-enyl-diphosphate synthase [Thermodesulfobacterium sp. TA1]
MYPKIKRRVTRKVWVGKISVGGDSPIRVQSMTNTPTADLNATLSQIQKLFEAGCEIVRVAVPDEKSAKALKDLVKESPIPVIADLHFATLLGEKAVKAGCAGIRINPGTFKNKANLERLLKICKDYNCCVRIGINAGSLEPEILKKYKVPSYKAMVESALRWVEYVVETVDYHNLKVSLKSSNWWETIKAYQAFSKKSDFPLHVGVTEAGGLIPGTIKNTMAISYLLLKGIGDTLRVSLTADPVEEVYVAYEILKNLGLRTLYPEVIACPTCGRCEIDLFSLYQKVEAWTKRIKANLKLAVMGCVVNGPGEAKMADIGIAGGKGVGVIFREGKIIKKVPETQLLEEFFKEVETFLKEHPERLINPQ